MASALSKDIRRSIRASLGRFVAILLIVALGCGFYAGLRMSGEDMRTAADSFYDGTDLYDIRLLSSLGFSEEQVNLVAQTEGVEQVSAERSTDVMATLHGEHYAMRVSSFDSDAAQNSSSDGRVVVSDDDGYLNRLVLVEGSWPDEPGECVLSADRIMGESIKVGDEVQVLYGSKSLDGVLSTRTFTVVGTVHSSSYVSSISLGSTTLGSGTLQQYLYVSSESFDADCPYTEIFVKVQGAEDEFAGSDAYQQTVDAVADRLRDSSGTLASSRLDDLRSDAQQQLDEQRSTFENQAEEAQDQLDAAAATLEESAKELSDSRAQLDSGWSSYRSGAAQLSSERSQTEASLAAAREQLENSEQALDAAQEQIDAARSELDQQLSELDRQIDALTQQIAALEDAGDPTGQLSTLQETLAELQSKRSEAEAADAELDAKQSEVDAGRDRLSSGRAELEKQEAQAREQLAAAQQELDSSLEQLKSGEARIASGEAELAEGWAQYEQSRSETLSQLGDAAEALDRAQGDIDALESPDIYVLDRTKNAGVSSFEADSERMDNIAAVFPLIFFLVAALVALTTMTRMVEEDRVLIGTYKALGYGTGSIVKKYLVYAGVASVAGALIGILVLSQVLPAVILEAYRIIYNVPHLPFPQPIDWPIALLSRSRRRCHAARHLGCRSQLAAGAASGAHAAACAQARQAHPARTHPTALEPPELLAQGVGAQHLPLPQALLDDRHRHCRLHGAAADGIRATRCHLGHHRQPV
jgi:putative ABC transport system permease protein